MSQINPNQLANVDLVYISDEEPGYIRRKHGRGFSYFHPDGTRVRDQVLRERFADLVIPPAWTNVWICLEPNGHMQATGRDDADRKQYIYHPLWEEMRNRAKFARLYEFGQMLSKIRERVDADLRKHNLPREKVLALTVALLDETHMRIGNNKYTEQNGSHGLTTLKNEHADANSTSITFEFTGKSGVEREIDLSNPRLARLIKACQELPGQRLFQYEDGDAGVTAIESGDVNAYLRDIGEEDFSAKDFRTWAGTVAAVEVLQEMDVGETEEESDQIIVNAVKEVAEILGNTPAICRQYYIHPAILDAYLSGDLAKTHRRMTKRIKGNTREVAEETVLYLLKKMGYGES